MIWFCLESPQIVVLAQRLSGRIDRLLFFSSLACCRVFAVLVSRLGVGCNDGGNPKIMIPFFLFSFPVLSTMWRVKRRGHQVDVRVTHHQMRPELTRYRMELNQPSHSLIPSIV